MVIINLNIGSKIFITSKSNTNINNRIPPHLRGTHISYYRPDLAKFKKKSAVRKFKLPDNILLATYFQTCSTNKLNFYIYLLLILHSHTYKILHYKLYNIQQ